MAQNAGSTMPEAIHLSGRTSELAGGLTVRRLLPAALRRAVGPFVFFDHFGPVALGPEVDSDVGGHPHIGLATVSYLFDGNLMHRDSLGTVQAIAPGAVNWMTAGRGIVHSERVTEQERQRSRQLHGLQLWVALPPALEEIEPAFQHVPASDVPELTLPDATVRVLVGQAFGLRSPVRTASETLYLDVQLAPNADWTLPPAASEMALYSPEQSLQVDGQPVAAQTLVVLPDHQGATLRAGARGARFVVIGGAPLEKPVRMWWNYVSHDRARIAAAARRWADGGFDPIPGETGRVAGPSWTG